MADFLVQDGQTYLFQGDSITDAGRRAAAAPFGTGYAKLFIDLVTAHYPERDITWINKGIGGNRVTDLFDRWTDDTIRFQPDWVSILIGINDLHSVLRGAQPNVPVELYRERYDAILSRLEDETDAGVLLIDPFYMSADTAGDGFRRLVLDTIPSYIEVVHEMAESHGCRHIPMHEIFAEHLKYREPDFYCPEPVHPGPAGHLLIATKMLEALTG
ncbi:MAG TPA: SGNH/GDSL hydrolase family protein [Armatimonadota bacterium]|nr:SGNH/GDSL hydrolase family protein [Armatimonadota bacterium]